MMPWYLGNGHMAGGNWWGIGLGFLAVWSMVWSGLSLWHAARRGESGWFIFFLLVHTAGLIEIIYVVFIAKAFRSTAKRPVGRKK